MALMLTMNYLQNNDFIAALYVFTFFPGNLFFWKLKKKKKKKRFNIFELNIASQRVVTES